MTQAPKKKKLFWFSVKNKETGVEFEDIVWEYSEEEAADLIGEWYWNWEITGLEWLKSKEDKEMEAIK